MVRRTQDAVPNVELYNLRDARGEAQEETAKALNSLASAKGKQTGITGNQISRWERGVSRPSPWHRQLLADHFGVSVAELGLARPRSKVSVVPNGGVADALAFAVDDNDQLTDAPTEESQRDWLRIRRALGVQHVPLAKTAARLYPETARIGETGLIAGDGWLLAQPIPLSDVRIAMTGEPQETAISGMERESRTSRPFISTSQRYGRYSHAIRDIARPRLFENRPGWRLLNLDFTSKAGPALTFGDTTYFDTIDICEAVAHEAAAALLREDASIDSASWRGLNFRRAIGDPFDLSRRPVLPSTDTLTIRASIDGASFVLHNRNSGNVASSGGMLGVMPAGTFQPSTVRYAEHAADFDLWRNIMREYSEEFLGNPEHGGDGQSVDYTSEPFATLDAGIAAGKIRAYCFGVALDALTLWGEILTVVVFDADIYDKIFAKMVSVNTEGSVVRIGSVIPTPLIPFTEHILDELSAGGRLAPEAASCLALAWQHRRQILSA